MKIVDVRTISCEMPFPEPGLTPGWIRQHYKKSGFMIVEIETDEGLRGIGLQGGGGIIEPLIERQVKPYLMSKEVDLFNIERHWGKLLNFSRRSGLRFWGIEIALFDLIGKALKMPIYKLLGGCQDRVQAYAATMLLKEPEERAKDAVKLLEEGFKAIKIRAHNDDPKQDLKVVEAVRDAVGDEMEIMVDANQRYHDVLPVWSHRTAFKMAKALDKLNVYWLEEPLYYDDLDTLTQLAASVDMYIAGAEAEQGIERFRHLLEKGCFDIVQPDVTAFGYTGLKKVSVLAEAYDKMLVPHVDSITGIGLAIGLQGVGALPNCPYVEVGYEPPIVTKELRNKMLEEPIWINMDGYFEIPNKPGLGVELNYETIAEWRVK